MLTVLRASETNFSKPDGRAAPKLPQADFSGTLQDETAKWISL
jgi:hypothetical protein